MPAGRVRRAGSDDQFAAVYRGLRRHDRWWVAKCRAASVVQRWAPSAQTLRSIGYVGVLFGGPFPPAVDHTEHTDVPTP
jgi:hypothetical protein